MALSPAVLLLAVVLSAAAAAVSLHVFTIFGVVPGAELLAAGVLGGLGLSTRLGPRLGPEQRLLIETAGVSATVAAALGLALPAGIAAAGGRAELGPLLMGAAGVVGAAAVASQRFLFDSALLPAAAPWGGARTAALAGSRAIGGLRAFWLVLGVGAGHYGAGVAAAPMLAAFGLAFLGNTFGLGVLAVGLIVRPTLPFLLRADVEALLLPPGLMIGAGAAGLVQVGFGLLASVLRPGEAADRAGRTGAPWWRLAPRRARSMVIGEGPAGRRMLAGAAACVGLYALMGLVAFALGGGLGVYGVPAAVGVALAAGLLAAAFQVFAGLARSRLGFVPTLGGGLAVLAVAVRLGLPPLGLLVVVALAVGVAPLFAEVGYRLKAGEAAIGPEQRDRQVLAALLGLASALVVVGASAPAYFEAGFIPPASAVLAAAIEHAADVAWLRAVGPWTLVGFVAQWLSGRGRNVGLLFATGLLVGNASLGWALLAGLAARTVLGILSRGRAEVSLALLGLGCIVGELVRLMLAGR